MVRSICWNEGAKEVAHTRVVALPTLFCTTIQFVQVADVELFSLPDARGSGKLYMRWNSGEVEYHSTGIVLQIVVFPSSLQYYSLR